MPAIIRGRVVDRQGRPVPDARVYILASPGNHPDVALLSGDDGGYSLPAVALPGTYRVGARAAGWYGVAEVIVGDEDAAVNLEIPLTEAE
jgi:hypothetical protein